jgi:hypothetical protein
MPCRRLSVGDRGGDVRFRFADGLPVSPKMHRASTMPVPAEDAGTESDTWTVDTPGGTVAPPGASPAGPRSCCQGGDGGSGRTQHRGTVDLDGPVPGTVHRRLPGAALVFLLDPHLHRASFKLAEHDGHRVLDPLADTVRPPILPTP